MVTAASLINGEWVDLVEVRLVKPNGVKWAYWASHQQALADVQFLRERKGIEASVFDNTGREIS